MKQNYWKDYVWEFFRADKKSINRFMNPNRSQTEQIKIHLKKITS